MIQPLQLPIDILSNAISGNSSCQMLSEDQSECASVKLFDLCGHTGFITGYSTRGQANLSFDFYAVIPLSAYQGQTTPFKSHGQYAQQRIGATVKSRGAIFVVHQIIPFTSTLPSAMASISIPDVRKYMERPTGHGLWLTEAYLQRRSDPIYRAYRHLVVMLLDDLAVLFWKGAGLTGEGDQINRCPVDFSDLEGFDQTLEGQALSWATAPIIDQRGQLALF